MVGSTACPFILQGDTGDRAEGESVEEGHGILRAPLSQLRVHLLFIKDRQVGCPLFFLTHTSRAFSAHFWHSNIGCIILDFNDWSALFFNIVIVIVMQAIFEDDCAQVSSEKELLEGIEHFLRGSLQSLEG